MKKVDESVIQFSLRLLLRPVMRYCLRRALKLQEVIEGCKAALIDAATEELAARGEKQTVNRLSIMTGLHRADVSRLLESDQPVRLKTSTNVVNRLIAAWQSQPDFTTSAGKPRTLSFDGKKGEFAELVASVSADPNPYSLLIELERIGAVEHTSRGLRLLSPEYIVRSDPSKSFRHLSQDSEDLITAVEENIFTKGEPNLHLRTEYDRIPESRIKTVREWLLQEGSKFHAKVRDYLSRHDLDINPKLPDRGKCFRVAVCSFSRVEIEDPSEPEDSGK